VSLLPDSNWDQFSIKDMARPKGEAELMRVLFKLSPEHWEAVAVAVDRAGANEIWAGVARTMASRLLPTGKSPSEKQTKILKKSLVRFGDIPKLKGVLSKEDQDVLQQG
jgi:hypothetical protein